MEKRKSGFTLVEIMLVVFIISLLASLVTLEAVRLRRIANEMNAQANLKAIGTSFEIYASAHSGDYAPTEEENLQFLVDGKYATQDFVSSGRLGNYDYRAALINPDGYDIRAMAHNPLLAEHNYQLITGAKLLRSDSSSPSDTDFKSF